MSMCITLGLWGKNIKQISKTNDQVGGYLVSTCLLSRMHSLWFPSQNNVLKADWTSSKISFGEKKSISQACD